MNIRISHIFFIYYISNYNQFNMRESILTTITNCKTLPKQFRVKDVNKFCNDILLHSPSFLSKHCENNPGNYNSFFIRISKGLYTLK